MKGTMKHDNKVLCDRIVLAKVDIQTNRIKLYLKSIGNTKPPLFRKQTSPFQKILTTIHHKIQKHRNNSFFPK